MLDISTLWLVSVPKVSVLETSRRELSEDVSSGMGALLVVEQPSLENRRVRYPIKSNVGGVPYS